MSDRSSTAKIFGDLVSGLISANPDVAQNKKSVLMQLAGKLTGSGNKIDPTVVEPAVHDRMTSQVIRTVKEGWELNIDVRKDASDITLAERNRLDALAAATGNLPDTAKAHKAAIVAKEQPVRSLFTQQTDDEKRAIDKLRQMIAERIKTFIEIPKSGKKDQMSKLDATEKQATLVSKELIPTVEKGKPLAHQVDDLEDIYLKVASSEAKTRYYQSKASARTDVAAPKAGA